MAGQKRVSRRGLLGLVAGLAAVAWGWQRFGVRPLPFDFGDIPGLPGWRVLETGPVTGRGSATGAVFAGIGAEAAPEPLPPERLCQVLFGDPAPGRMLVAVFSDFFCPNCRDLDARLAARLSDPASGIALTRHQLPLLGPASELAARAALAAGLQGGSARFHARLAATPFRPTLDHFARTADAAGLNPGRLLLDMNGPEVDRKLGDSAAAAQTLGVWGTPGLVVGRTLVMGAIRDDDLDRLIALERQAAPVCADPSGA